jgi:hypothetical protein
MKEGPENNVASNSSVYSIIDRIAVLFYLFMLFVFISPSLPKPANPVILGLFITFVLGMFSINMISLTKRELVAKVPELNVDPRLKDAVTGAENAGAYIGLLERVLFFTALSMGANGPFIIAGYLGFKVAAKWEAWRNIVKVPRRLEDIAGGEENLDYFLLRKHWGSIRLSTFLVGTLYNMLCAMAGYFVSRMVTFPIL